MPGIVTLAAPSQPVAPTLPQPTLAPQKTTSSSLTTAASDQLALTSVSLKGAIPATALGQLAAPATYTVKRGDTLGSIAAAQLGGSQKWKTLYELNRDVIADPNRLETGMKLRLTAEDPRAKLQLEALAAKYGVVIPGGTPLKAIQPILVKAIVTHMAETYGVPLGVGLGVSGHESGGWKMWKNIDTAQVVTGVNKNAETGRIYSTDWGVMQINDYHHPRAFPQVKEDLEANIRYGVQFLAQLHKTEKGTMGLGFGDWDKTIAAYNLGHAPYASEIEHATQYVRAVQQYAKRAGFLPPTCTVQPGETLAVIAERELGDAKRWRELWQLNLEQVPAPEKLAVGTVLNLPLR